MSVVAGISLKVILHLNVLMRCLISIIRDQVRKSPGLCSLGLTLIVPLVAGYFRLVDLIAVARWLAPFVQLEFVLVLVLRVLEFRLSFEIVLTFVYIFLLIVVFLVCEVILVLEIVVRKNITVICDAYGFSLQSIWLDDVGWLERVLDWVQVQIQLGNWNYKLVQRFSMLIDGRLLLHDLRRQIRILTFSIIIIVILENKLLLHMLFCIVVIVMNILIISSSIYDLIGLSKLDLFILIIIIKLHLLKLRILIYIE